MNVRMIGCRDCEAVTSGDCGKHGPMFYSMSAGNGHTISDNGPAERALSASLSVKDEPALDLEPIKAREAAATKGPWKIGWTAEAHVYSGTDKCAFCERCGPVVMRSVGTPSDPERFGEATHRHWISDDDWHRISTEFGVEICANYDYESGGIASSEVDADFIAHARQDIPALLREIERLRATPATPPQDDKP